MKRLKKKKKQAAMSEGTEEHGLSIETTWVCKVKQEKVIGNVHVGKMSEILECHVKDVNLKILHLTFKAAYF